MNKIIEVAVVIIRNSDNQILITKRNQNQVFANHWEFPGGKVEPGETSKQAAIREVSEEVKLELDYNSTHQYDTATITNETTTINITYYLSTRFFGTATITDQLALKWVPIETLHAYKFPKVNDKVVAKLQFETKVKSKYSLTNVSYDSDSFLNI